MHRHRTAGLWSLLLVLSLPACATANLCHYGKDAASSAQQDQNAALGLGVLFLATVAWDVATLPLQVALGWYPYGDTGKPRG